MIIFDLDTLADCEHRRHFIIDPTQCGEWKLAECWTPDFKAYNSACVDDKPVESTIKVFHSLIANRCFNELEIWSGRCESVRNKTLAWLMQNDLPTAINLKMRPIGDDSPQGEIFEKFIEDRLSDLGKQIDPEIEMVFSSHKPTIDMFKKRDVFVFDCNQAKE